MGGMHGGGAADERDPADPPAAPERPTSHDHGAMR
jgi:hypothetical protein